MLEGAAPGPCVVDTVDATGDGDGEGNSNGNNSSSSSSSRSSTVLIVAVLGAGLAVVAAVVALLVIRRKRRSLAQVGIARPQRPHGPKVITMAGVVLSDMRAVNTGEDGAEETAVDLDVQAEAEEVAVAPSKPEQQRVMYMGGVMVTAHPSDLLESEETTPAVAAPASRKAPKKHVLVRRMKKSPGRLHSAAARAVQEEEGADLPQVPSEEPVTARV